MSLTAPVNGATIAFGGDVMLTANASDFDGAVTKVEFMEGSNKLGENSAEPYQFTWAKPPVGSYTLTARSTDNRGL
ncbi:MAG: hypothetical protein IPJ27_02410 [Candidatus Accumulibacter sp.]|uniref:Uncharacterized protein n=1 Tax=Candidatus Accumulibacter proximus TaxID=2954385 RepID=A0A935PXD9_9PROT|nr:hypothetical protein [Candidatus Accumulibacter proximus]